MGLLQKVSDGNIAPQKVEQPAVSEKPVQKKSSSVGLFKKSLIVSSSSGLDFFKFSSRYSFDFCAILGESDGIYCVEQSAGFDGISICNSISTKDFWNGIITMKNELFQFSQSQNNIQPFYQFFSPELKDKITTLNVIKYDEGKILFFSSDSKKLDVEAIINDVKAVNTFKETSPVSQSNAGENDYYLCKFDFSQAVESFINACKKKDNFERLNTALSLQIYYNLLHNFPLPSRVVQTSQGQFKIAFVLTEEIPFELIANHMRFENAFILKEHSDLITAEYTGKAASFKQLKDFLQAE